MPIAKRGDLVQIHRIILEPEKRSDSLPACTKTVPYECWIKGFLLNEEACLGENVKIETFIGREIMGTLFQINPIYEHDFGKPIKELLSIAKELTKQKGKHWR
jgi:2-amino-4-ketopentanoate thiolase alpha subunit